MTTPFPKVDRRTPTPAQRARAARQEQARLREGHLTPVIADRPTLAHETPTIVVAPPNERSTEWHPLFCETLSRLGTIRATCAVMHIGRGTVDTHREQYPEFAAALAQAEQDFREWVFEQGVQRIRAGDGSMIQFYLRALDERFRDRRSIEYTMTEKDRREIERQAKEAGLDPQKVLANVQGLQSRRGTLKLVS